MTDFEFDIGVSNCILDNQMEVEQGQSSSLEA